MAKGKIAAREPGGLKLVGLVYKGAALIVPNRTTKSSLLTMVSLEYVGERNSVPLRGES